MGVSWTEPVCTLLGIFCRLFCSSFSFWWLQLFPWLVAVSLRPLSLSSYEPLLCVFSVSNKDTLIFRTCPNSVWVSQVAQW